MQGVSKRYGGVRALQDAQLVIEAGRIHAVLGENGAGKSTLIKIMAGVVAPDEGRMLLDGEPVSFASQKPFTTSARNLLCFTKICCHTNLEKPTLPLQSSHPNCSISGEKVKLIELGFIGC